MRAVDPGGRGFVAVEDHAVLLAVREGDAPGAEREPSGCGVSLDTLARVRKEDARLRELHRCQTDLYYLCTEVLGYAWNPDKQQGMTEAFHGPLCARMDRLREHPRVFAASHRGSLKTTVLTIGLAIQEILRDPDVTILIPHAVEDEAVKIGSEIVNHFRMNKRLRALRPDICPAPNAKWWYGAGRMTIKREKFSRQPTVLCVGAGSEIVGAHVDLILADDIIARRTIENSELPKIKSWWQNTALPVLNPAGRIRVVGTRWHPDDIYGEFIANTETWDCLIRACSEIDGAADYTLQNPVHHGPEDGGREKAMARLERARKEMGGDFPAQMMNDPSPASEKPWQRDREIVITKKDADGPGFKVVVSDPAPAKTGSLDALGAKRRADGSKDYWANAVLKFRRNGMRNEIILLDGSMSREWDVDAGFDEVCRLKRVHGATHHAIESTGQAIALYSKSMDQAARRAGVPNAALEMKGTYRGNAKNIYFAALASAAASGEFVISDGCDKSFLEMFLGQAREWRPLESGGNGLRYDDCANVVSFGTDPVFSSHAPQVVKRGMEAFNPLADDEQGEQYHYRTRHSAA